MRLTSSCVYEELKYDYRIMCRVDNFVKYNCLNLDIVQNLWTYFFSMNFTFGYLTKSQAVKQFMIYAGLNIGMPSIKHIFNGLPCVLTKKIALGFLNF